MTTDNGGQEQQCEHDWRAMYYSTPEHMIVKAGGLEWCRRCGQVKSFGKPLTDHAQAAQAQRYREALAKYGNHTFACRHRPISGPSQEGCICGLDDALAPSAGQAICNGMIYTDEVLSGPRCVLPKGHEGFCSEVSSGGQEEGTK